MMQLTDTELEIVKRMIVGATPEQLLRERQRYMKWNYPETEAEYLAIKQKAIKSGVWFDVMGRNKNLKGAL
jgi:hypothetical protein